MSYLVLARRYRPQTFEDVYGQDHVTRTLQNSIRRDKVGHAYLFAGLRGVGKTSIARIFAKALNCATGPTPTPCNSCSQCSEITSGKSLAVREIDGASHNSVDNVRELLETFRTVPSTGYRYKVYIIDEVHMLSMAAFNALLKSLEEPPPHTVFILATTESHKIPDTVISRCQRYDLRALGNNLIIEGLEQIASEEKLVVEPEALAMIAKLAGGSMRDAQSLFERVMAFCDGAIDATAVSAVAGTVTRSRLLELSSAILRKSPADALAVVDETFAHAVDTTLLLKEFVSHWRDILIAKSGGPLSSVDQDQRQELLAHGAETDLFDLQDLMHLARVGADEALRSFYPRFAFEALIVRMATRESSADLTQLISKLDGAASAGGLVTGVVSAPKILPVAPKAKTSTVTSSKVPLQSIPASSLEWTKFLDYAAKNVSKMASEYLKRCAVIEFSVGVLKLRGPEFSMKSLQGSETNEKLLQALRVFSGEELWRIQFESSGQVAKADDGSLYTEQSRQVVVEREKNRAEVASHDLVLQLQKVFPGSTIESA